MPIPPDQDLTQAARGHRRELVQGDAVSLAVDAGPCESDRTFFRQHPKRNFGFTAEEQV